MLAAVVAPMVRAACAPRARRWLRALDDVDAAQRATLRRIVEAAAPTRYARSLGLAPESGIDAFRRRVPVVDYEALAPWIEAQRGGERNAIAPGRIRCYEPTSGSSGARKHIPYNDALLRTFHDAFAVWAHDLLSGPLRLRSGRMFASVSTPMADAGGLADDRDYLRPGLRALVGRFLVTPPRVADPAAFHDALALTLLRCEDLEVVSVWNPTYLLRALEHIEQHRERWLPHLSPTRQALLRQDPVPWSALWPSLALVSCWTSAAAAAPARELARCLPHARMQGKGLLATEAPITVPLAAAGGCVPLVDSVFLEFADATGSLHLCSELATGAEYAVVVTQPGGLLRYRLHDRVRVTGRHRGAPVLEFVGRMGVCDLVGEKLGESFVARAIATAAGPDAFAMLLPVVPATGAAHYCLLTDHPDAAVGTAVDRALGDAMRYREARALGQLGPVEVIACPRMRSVVHDALIASGMREGDIKEVALLASVDVAARLRAGVLQRISA